MYELLVSAIHSANTPEYPIIYLGAASAGVTLTTINPAYTVCEYFCLSIQRPEPKLGPQTRQNHTRGCERGDGGSSDNTTPESHGLMNEHRL